MTNNKKKISINEFFNLPVKQQEAVMSGIAHKANQDQRDLVRRYDEMTEKAARHSG